jgi:hypothetical protein
MKRPAVHPAAELEETTLLLSIGGVVGEVSLIGATPEFADDVRRRYAGFSLPNGKSVPRGFALEVMFSENRRLGGPWPEGVIQPEVTSSSSRIDIRRWDFLCRMTSGPRGGSFRGNAECLAQPWSFESLLRVIWSVLLPRAGGGLFHACGLRDGERTVLAAGPSGAGKTTLARKASHSDEVLSDEVVALNRGDDGRWRMWATPFFGELQRGAGTLQSWPLAGIAFLEQRSQLAVSRTPMAQAVLRALECLMCFETDPDTVQSNFALIIALCAEVPTFTCASRKQDGIDAIRGAWRPFLDRRKTVRPPTSNARELIGALRTSIERHGTFAFSPRGSSMRPWLRTGDALFVEAVDPARVVAGDVVLYWRAGRRPEQDSLICHRVLGRLPTEHGARFYAKGDALGHIETFDHGRDAQVIGRVKAISRNGRSWPLPGRLANLAILLSSLLLMPVMKLKLRRS